MAYPDICVKKGDIGELRRERKKTYHRKVYVGFEGSAVIENAGIYDMASINGNSLIAGDAKIKGHAIVKGQLLLQEVPLLKIQQEF